MNIKKSMTALALAGLLGLTACSADDATKSEAAPAASESSTSKPKESSTPEKSEAPAMAKDLQDELAAFGEEWTYKDGISVRVDYTGTGMATETAAGAEGTGGQIRLFDVSITNNTEKIFDPAMFYADVNYGPEGTAAERVFDTGAGLGDNFQGKILPGGTQKVTMAYAIPTDAPTDMLMTVMPSWDHTEKLFHGVAVL